MKALSQFTRLIGVPRPAEQPEDDHRVLYLFKNRAELKKAYAELQEEVYRLKDRIKQQEGATARVQEMLAALEARLGVAETAYPALVFYQLRALWQRGRELLEQFTGELAATQEERQRRALLAAFNRRQFVERQAAQAAVREATTRLQMAQEFVTELQTQRAKLTRFWHYFRRRDLDRRVHGAAAVLRETGAAQAAAQAALREAEAQNAPEFPGLSVEARRAINLAAIAYAEVLCLRLADTPLVPLARAAVGRREPAGEYGPRPACEALITLIAAARGSLESKRNLAADVKARSAQLRRKARYRSEAEASPTPESVAIGAGDELAGRALATVAAGRVPNVLGEDAWDLHRVLLR
ncbi:MAG TPA: hypothetical protein VMB48_05115 [Steroidobacteraceae bacterium]|nr:hypothetical protein [Steroidobacteraceae bacterium]